MEATPNADLGKCTVETPSNVLRKRPLECDTPSMAVSTEFSVANVRKPKEKKEFHWKIGLAIDWFKLDLSHHRLHRIKRQIVDVLWSRNPPSLHIKRCHRGFLKRIEVIPRSHDNHTAGRKDSTRGAKVRNRIERLLQHVDEQHGVDALGLEGPVGNKLDKRSVVSRESSFPNRFNGRSCKVDALRRETAIAQTDQQVTQPASDLYDAFAIGVHRDHVHQVAMECLGQPMSLFLGFAASPPGAGDIGGARTLINESVVRVSIERFQFALPRPWIENMMPKLGIWFGCIVCHGVCPLTRNRQLVP